MNTTENNKLIAEFMGNSFEPLPDTNNECFSLLGSSDVIHITDFETGIYTYHSDWNLLMSVVEKIEEMGFTTAIKTKYVRVNPKENANYYNYISYVAFNENGWYANHPAPTHDSELSHPPIDRGDEKITKLQAIYKAVTQFIEWYNANK